MTDQEIKFTAPQSSEEALHTAIQSFGLPSVAALLSTYPEFTATWILFSGIYIAYFKTRQNRINDFADYLQNNTHKFGRELIETDEFQDGLQLTFEAFIKQRVERKREMIKEVFLDYSLCTEKDHFHIERIFSVMESISLNSIKFLALVKHELLPQQQSDHSENTKKTSSTKLDAKNNMVRLERDNPISRYILLWVLEDDSLKEKMWEITTVVDKWSRLNQSQKNRAKNWWTARAELLSLGIIEIVVRGAGTRGGTRIEYALSEFGHEFINYISEEIDIEFN